MLQAWILKAALYYLLGKLLEFADTAIPWAQWKAEGADFIRGLIPGKLFDDDAVALFLAVMDAFERVLQAEENLKEIIALLVDNKPNEAAKRLKDLILGTWVPTDEAGLKFLALLAEKPGIFAVAA